MPDNVTAPAGGVSFATDEIGGVHFPYAKLAWGANDTAVPVADVSGQRLPVTMHIANGQAVALDAATLAALEQISVTVDKLGRTTRAYDFAAGQRLTTSGAAQVRSAAITASEILLHASVRGFVRVGDAAVAATVGPGSIPLEAGEKFHLQLAPGTFVSFIRDGASDGSLTILPVA